MTRAGWLRAAVVCVLALPAGVWVNYQALARGDAAAQHVDTILVLGFPADAEGRPLPEQRERVLEASGSTGRVWLHG